MCENCGCGEGGGYTLINPAADHSYQPAHQHGHEHQHDHDHLHDEYGHIHDHLHEHIHTSENESDHRRIAVETDVLQRNNLLAERNRGYFEGRNISCFNLVSSPGSGKTSILERTISSVKRRKIFVVEGDQQTTLDADRIQAAGVPVVQVNTGTGCHLDAAMINHAVKTLNPSENSVFIIENVGNLVCPALFDLGEKQRVVIISVTEGADKPLKYPHMFASSHLCLINKIDLLPYLDFNVEEFKANALKINRNMQFIELSAKTGDGFERWIAILESL